MPEGSEIKKFEIPHSTLRAAQILSCDPQTLMGLYDSDFFEEVEDNKIVTDQMHEIYSILCIFLDSEKNDHREKIDQAMEIDPLFKEFVIDFLLDNCADEITGDSSLLSEETFEAAMELINGDDDLGDELDRRIERNTEYEKNYQNEIRENILCIKADLDNILHGGIDSGLMCPNSYVRKIHELVFIAMKKSPFIELSNAETCDYQNHILSGPCSICDLLERREFKTFNEFLDFIKDGREFMDIMNNSRVPKPPMN